MYCAREGRREGERGREKEREGGERGGGEGERGEEREEGKQLISMEISRIQCEEFSPSIQTFHT